LKINELEKQLEEIDAKIRTLEKGRLRVIKEHDPAYYEYSQAHAERGKNDPLTLGI